MASTIAFKPIKFDWVAIHPEPIGIVQFIGGAFFGTFPTIFYREVLGYLFNRGFTVIAKPYRFTFQHWAVAIDLLDSQKELFETIHFEADKAGYGGLNLYRDYLEAIADPKNPVEKGKFFWLGHSLGCKYIALLELLSLIESDNPDDTKLKQEILAAATQYGNIDCSGIASLTNQAMILLAPVLADLDNAIPIPALAELFKNVLQVVPNKEKTKELIVKAGTNNGGRFHLVNGTGFVGDIRAKDTLDWLAQFKDRFVGGFEPQLRVERTPLGPHLSPMGTKNVDPTILEDVRAAITKLS